VKFRFALIAGLVKPWRSRRYRDWVKRLPCVACGQRADDPHHLLAPGLKGMGTKLPDTYVIPLCRPHHDAYHADRVLWQQRYGDQWEWVAHTLAQAVHEGVLTLA
jgi:Protein of unknown function (DUF968)